MHKTTKLLIAIHTILTSDGPCNYWTLMTQTERWQWTQRSRFSIVDHCLIARLGDRKKYLGEIPTNWGAEWRVPKLGDQVGLGMGKGDPSQPTMGSGKRRVLRGVQGGTQTGNTFWRILKAKNAPFCTYMPMPWVRQTVFHVIFGDAMPRLGDKNLSLVSWH